MRTTVFGAEGVRVVDSPDWEALLASDQHIVWVDMDGPDEADTHVMRDVFHFHPLAIEDTTNHRQRAKIEEYDSHLFLILNPMALIPDEDFPEMQTVEVREMDVFVGPNYLVTVHQASEPAIPRAQQRAASSTNRLPMSSGFLLYTLMDIVVDDYFPILEALGDQIEEVEDLVLHAPREQVLKHLMTLKRTLRHMWQIIWPQQSVLNHLLHEDDAFLHMPALAYYFRDIYDHAMRIAEMLNTFRDTLTSVTDLYMSAVSNRLNRVVNRLTVFTLTIGILTVISGFYGMNFEETWPAFADPNGVPFVVGLMVALVAGVLVMLRRLGWY